MPYRYTSPAHMKTCDGKSSCHPGTQCPSDVTGCRTLKALVECYRAGRHPIHTELKWYSSTKNFPKAVTNAALALTCKGTKHPHQRRIPLAVLKTMKRELCRRIKEMQKARDFDAILAIIEGCKVKGFGKLACYDAALRIAARLKRMPKRVYLHAGTRKGAYALGLASNVRSLGPSEFPHELRMLRPYEIEDFLCIFESDLGNLKGRVT